MKVMCIIFLTSIFLPYYTLVLPRVLLMFQAYKGAIVEHHPFVEDTPEKTIAKNLQAYKDYMEIAHNQNVDIIVFPEYGLTTLVDEPEGYAIDFSTDDQFLKQFKSLALKHSIYLVINLLEKVKTTYYNTNLVYNRKGEIIAKYRKIRLFNEPRLTPGNETVIFSTDFGVTFGVFTCFDIAYHKPARTILENCDVTDIVYPHAWFSTMPFYTALTMQHGYYAANDVNILAANYGQSEASHGGSGIYVASHNTGEIYIDATSSSKMMIRDVATIGKRQCSPTCTTSPSVQVNEQRGDISDFKTYIDFNASLYEFQDINLSTKEVSTRICYKKFCCNFNISIGQPAANEVYKLMAYDGKMIFDRSEVEVKICSLVACQNVSNDSCGVRINGATIFSKISVDGNFESNSATFYTPLTLNYNLQPILESRYCSSCNSSQIQLTTSSPQSNVLVFGIFGKNDSLLL